MGELVLGRQDNKLYVFRNGQVIEITFGESGTIISEKPVIGDVRINPVTGEVVVDYYNKRVRTAWLKQTARIIR
jgi:hypothetical protein